MKRMQVAQEILVAEKGWVKKKPIAWPSKQGDLYKQNNQAVEY